MSTQKIHKINQLLSHHKPGMVYLASWLEDQGISRELQKRYRKSGWLESIGTGAFKRPDDSLSWQSGVYTLQTQAYLKVHVGALTAMSLQGLAHYLRPGQHKVYLFSPPQVRLPRWFKVYDWQVPIQHVRKEILPIGVGVEQQEVKGFTLLASTPERAILECLYLAPDELDLMECYQILEGLTNLRPKYLQNSLEQCSSFKVKRLFLYMAKKAGHPWFKYLDMEKIDLGKGKRSITPGGVYDAEFRLTIPKELAEL